MSGALETSYLIQEISVWVGWEVMLFVAAAGELMGSPSVIQMASGICVEAP